MLLAGGGAAAFQGAAAFADPSAALLSDQARLQIAAMQAQAAQQGIWKDKEKPIRTALGSDSQKKKFAKIFFCMNRWKEYWLFSIKFELKIKIRQIL